MKTFLDYIAGLQLDEDIPRWSGYMPDKQLSTGSKQASFYDLHPVLRALLIADGTVTMAIEAIYREPVVINTVSQSFIEAPTSIPLLDVLAGEQVFFREVELIGEHSGKRYVRAYSLLKQTAIEPELWQQLKNEQVGMGVVLRSTAQNSFRQVVHIGGGNLSGEEGFVHRTYNVQIKASPAILITEIFDLQNFSSGYK